MDRTFAEETLARAVAVLGDTRTGEDNREHAALVIGTLLRNGCAYNSEADLTDLFSALGRACDVYLAVRRVLDGVRRLQPDTVVERAGHGVARMMARAFRDGDYEALAELLLVSFEEPKWIHVVRDEWAKAGVIWAVERLPDRYPLVLLIGGCVHAFGAVPNWMAEIAEAHPDLVTSSRLPREVRWTLHRAAPSVVAWKSLASENGWTPIIEPALFGHGADNAVETLQQVIGESTDKAASLRLRVWLRELTGEMS